MAACFVSIFFKPFPCLQGHYPGVSVPVGLHQSEKGFLICSLTCPTWAKQVLKPLNSNSLVFIQKAPQEPFLPLQRTEPLVCNFRFLSWPPSITPAKTPFFPDHNVSSPFTVQEPTGDFSDIKKCFTITPIKKQYSFIFWKPLS